METEVAKDKQNNTILVILGPSASGKTNFALKVAKKLDKNIISADSRQVYKRLDYSTRKFPTTHNIKKGKKCWIINKVKYYGYDIIKPYKEFSAYDFARFANRVIKKEKNNLPIICGGTGMYINALINNYDYKTMPANWELREQLSSKIGEELLQILKEKGYDTSLLNNSEIYNKQRLIRRIETFKAESLKQKAKSGGIKPKYNYLIIGIEREDYEKSINGWIKENFENSVKEVKWLLNKYPESPVFNGFIFKELLQFINEELSEEQTKERIFYEYKHYIKRQKTYFKKYFANTHWFTDKQSALEYIEKQI